ncbi:MAG: tetratricopeptide repeat protein, partial [Melioribacteraceae bacterium]|nr:tetratricopeptide repeat protein [Melioribacteraceae bacterium]
YNLMVDHLHPNIEGYNLIGDIFFDKMKQNNFLPDPVEPNITERDADSLLLAGLPYTKLDSTLSHFRITKLLKSYPFVSREESQRRKITYRLNNYIDTLALQVLSNKILWRVAHQRAADWYYSKKDYDNFMNEINAIINYQPYTEITYATATGKLINAKRYDDALYYLKQLHKLHPNDYTYKWLGSIALQKNNYEEAIKYLNKSLEYNPKDSQTWYNLSGSYYNSGQLEKAIYAVKQCLNIDGNNVTAKNFYNSLLMIRNQK